MKPLENQLYKKVIFSIKIMLTEHLIKIIWKKPNCIGNKRDYYSYQIFM